MIQLTFLMQIFLKFSTAPEIAISLEIIPTSEKLMLLRFSQV